MKKFLLSEKLSKVVIYVLTGLTAFAFGFFLQDAQQFYAANNPAAVSLPNPEIPRATLSPQMLEPNAASALVDDEDGSPVWFLSHAAQSATIEASVMLAHQQMQAVPPAVFSPVVRVDAEAPPVQGGMVLLSKRPDQAALDAELARLAGMGFEVSTGDFLYMGSFYNTAYCAEEYPHICGGNGVTASGTVPTPGLTCAADWSLLPSGTWLYIDGVGVRRVEDTGSAIKADKLDINVDTHDYALKWGGLGWHDVWVLSWPQA